MNIESLLKTLMAIDWKYNRRWVNMGVNYLKNHYSEYDDLVKKYPQAANVLKRLKVKVDEKGQKVVQSSKVKEMGDGNIFGEIWNQVEEEVIVQSEKYANWMRVQLEENAKVYEAYMNMSSSEKKSKYPAGFYNTQGTEKYKSAHNILNNTVQISKFLERAKTNYINSEKDKIKKLLFKTTEKIGKIFNPKVGKFVHDQVSITLDNEIERGIVVNLERISAGGYNIQRYHYRWLSRFVLNGKKYELKSS